MLTEIEILIAIIFYFQNSTGTTACCVEFVGTRHRASIMACTPARAARQATSSSPSSPSASSSFPWHSANHIINVSICDSQPNFLTVFLEGCVCVRQTADHGRYFARHHDTQFLSSPLEVTLLQRLNKIVQQLSNQTVDHLRYLLVIMIPHSFHKPWR